MNNLDLVSAGDLLDELSKRFIDYVFVGRKVDEDDRKEFVYTTDFGGEVIICDALLGFMKKKIANYDFNGSEND